MDASTFWMHQANASKLFFAFHASYSMARWQVSFCHIGGVEAMARAAALKQRLAAGEAVYGLIHGLASATVAELAALAGYDVIIVDDEHGAGDSHLHLQLFQAIAAGGAACMVRLPGADPLHVGRALDLGADGLLVPGVHGAADAVALVRACRYPPAGARGHGIGIARASGYGLFAGQYGSQANDAVFISVLVESRRAVADIAGIVAVDGVDAVVVGLQDLAADLGWPGEVGHPEVQAALPATESAALHAGKVVGTIVHPGATVTQLLARGHRFITLGADTRLMYAAMQEQLAACRVP